ncbi:MAG: winged helix-turn-helix transcriptional regulator [Hellea sp.]|nr:winged helix-turn-helix transcriptional regulator [Hellea sp.]
MSLFDVKSGIEKSSDSESFPLPVEARFHAVLSGLASDYVRLIKKTVLPKLDMPSAYTIRDVQVLAAIRDSGGPCTSSEVFRATGLDPATVTRAVKNLVSDNFVVSTENAGDSRSRFLNLTDTGRDLADQFLEGCQNLFESDELAISKPNSDEWASLFRQLKRLSNRVQILTLKNF